MRWFPLALVVVLLALAALYAVHFGEWIQAGAAAIAVLSIAAALHVARGFRR